MPGPSERLGRDDLSTVARSAKVEGGRRARHPPSAVLCSTLRLTSMKSQARTDALPERLSLVDGDATATHLVLIEFRDCSLRAIHIAHLNGTRSRAPGLWFGRA